MYISDGNTKLDYPIWNLPSRLTCINSTELCRKYCYAAKAERLYKGAMIGRFSNYELSTNPYFDWYMISELRVKKKYAKKGLFRIHESGDFYNQKYLDKWFNICKSLSDIKFLAYTKSWKLDWDNKPSNMIVYWSIWEDTINPPTTGLFAYAGNCGSGFECPHSCRSGCRYCFSQRGNVHFKIH